MHSVKLAIIVGNSEYLNLNTLSCCINDVDAIVELLQLSNNYNNITNFKNLDSTSLKTMIRNTLDTTPSISEIFFYFTGHGEQIGNEFFYCTTDFDSKRPYETGLSTEELHTLLRSAKAELVVKVIDACNSGSMLIKSDNMPPSTEKFAFKYFIQMSSCLDFEYCPAGQPLSPFTEIFRSACLRKTKGHIYYTDIMNVIRDAYINDKIQTPLFVNQSTGREIFVNDAFLLNPLREKITQVKMEECEEDAYSNIIPNTTPSLFEQFDLASKYITNKVQMNEFLDIIHDKVATSCDLLTKEFAYYDISCKERNSYEGGANDKYVAIIMSNQKRIDDFVTATYRRQLKKLNPLFGYMSYEKYLDNNRYEEDWDLHLNCDVSRAQMQILLTPKFLYLRQIVLTIIFVPSLVNCYIFEFITTHKLTDFNEFQEDGNVESRHWWKPTWQDSTDRILTHVEDRLKRIIQSQLENAEQELKALKQNE